MQENNAAMQTKLLLVVSGIHKLSLDHEAATGCLSRKGNPMSKSVSIALARPSNPFGRLFATIDRLLLAYAEMTIRNGDVPRCII